ncbi:MAG: hypothetical protein HY263_08450 [Chloroflexi bacterium]|nr:hypothetical protein [Chloroflexota bacterium]
MTSLRGAPWGIVLFLGYAFLILAGIGLTMGLVIDLATTMAVSLPGVVDMVLLAYTIFTITLVLQRKAAARGLALGLSSLTLPPIVFGLVYGLLPVAIFFAALAALLFRGLRGPAARAWLAEP